MITIDSDPQANPIYIGGVIISLFHQSDFNIKTVERLFDEVRAFLNISFDVFVQALDWLYIIGVIELNEAGELVYASK
ncbi:hypothetical protein KGP17_20375 [Serratia sp. JSRIV001]|uniref:ABC-three component system middle component 6 n=1 Tax=Serratia sp. JSRIV001 TaxID=2831893 RepID=UPI001CBBE2FE|nr:ABC-three component system middle component 6 [Serratia sp. JSRIV001]UAN44771.1 hypothetical protein KGP17_20375 [Serratia sp. JSRIV001]